MTIYQRAREFRRELLDGEADTQRRLAAAYAQAYDRALRDFEEITRQIAAAKRAGEEVNKNWLKRLRHTERIRAQLALAAEVYAKNATGLIEASQYESIRKAVAHSNELIAMGKESLGQPRTFTRAPIEAVQALVGHLSDGSPLRAVLQAAAMDSANRAEAILIEGVGTGKNPRQIGRDLKTEAGIPAIRAATIARTETLRAYNSATIENYRANDDVLDGYTRIESLDRRTCALCWAMHGKVSKLEDDLATHPNCRGTVIPNVVGDKAKVESGEARFARQPASAQEAILGPKTFALYQSGAIGLGDVVRTVNDPQWGPTLKRVPYRELEERFLAQAA